MKQLLLPFLLLFVNYPRLMSTQQTSGTPPDLSVVLSRKALDFLLGETQKILDRQLHTLKLPSASQPIEGGSVEIHDVSLNKFVPPTYFYDLESPHTLIWGLNDASLYVSGQWSGNKKIVLPVKGKGGFVADLEQLSLLLRAQLGRNESSGLTKIDYFQCNASIANLSVGATGGVVGYVLNIFRSTVADKVKPLLEEAICNQMEYLIEQDVDHDLFQKLPTKYDVGRKFQLTVALIGGPVVDRQTGYIALDHQVGIVYDGKDKTGQYLQSGQQGLSPGPASALAPPLNRMMYVRISEKPVNMLLYTMHAENMTAFIIDERTSQQTSNYLRLDCTPQENCLGRSLEGISSIYPAPAKGAFRIYTSRPPQMRITDGAANLSAPVTMEINVRTGPPQYAEDNLLIADIDMAATVHFSVDKEGKKILGDWKLYKFDLVSRPVGVAGLVKVDNAKLADSLRGFVADEGGKMLLDGFDVPVASTILPGYTMTSVGLKLLPKIMQFEADMAVQSAFKARSDG